MAPSPARRPARPAPTQAGVPMSLPMSLPVAVLVAVLVALALPLLGPAAPARASASCLSEKPGLFGLTCDDEKPPETANARGAQSGPGQVSVTATGSYSDADVDPIDFQCQLVGTAPWGPCTLSGLSNGTQQVAIRAVDTADLARVTRCDDFLCGSTPEVPDVDATPAVVSVAVSGNGGGGGGGTTPPPPGPGGAPETQITGGPRDRITPAAPVSVSRRIVFTLASSEPATYNCAVNARKIPCHDGTNVLKRVASGAQVLVAQAVDRDGNFDATPASLSFYVPVNLSPRQGPGWRRVQRAGSYAGDYVVTTRRGAVLTLGEVRGIRELRLLAPTGPRLGKVAVRVGSGAWFTVRLTAPQGRPLRVFALRRAGARPISGRIQVRAVSVPRGGSVAVDAVVAR